MEVARHVGLLSTGSRVRTATPIFMKVPDDAKPHAASRRYSPSHSSFNGTATTEIYTVSDTLSLHVALPISIERSSSPAERAQRASSAGRMSRSYSRSEEHTSELQSPDTISYAVFCLKK